MTTWTIFKNHLLEVGLTQDHCEITTPRTLTTNDLFLFYLVWGPARIEVPWNSIWLRTRSHMTSHYTWGSTPTLHDFGGVLGWPLDTHFLLGSHNFMVTALSSCVKWLLCKCPKSTVGVVTPLSSHSRRSENAEVAPSPWMMEGPSSENGNPYFFSSTGEEWKILGEGLPHASCFSPGVMEAHTFLR